MAGSFQPRFVDLVRNYTTTTGTDDFVLGTAVNGFTSFTDGCQTGDTFYYSALGLDNPGDTEVGRGTLLAGGIVSRDPINGTKTNFKCGTKSIALIAAAEWYSEVEALRANGAAMLSVEAFGAKGDSDETGSGGTDDTAAIQAAIDHVDGLGGGTLYFPPGYYKLSSYLTLCKDLRLLGAGPGASWLVQTAPRGGGADAGESLRNGSVLYSNWPSNGSTEVHIVVEHLSFLGTDAANAGAAFYDNCGSIIQINNCTSFGLKYGIVLDQSELVDISGCDLSSSIDGGAAVWLVNGGSLRATNSGDFTNRIAVRNSNINCGLAAYGIVDDGGNAHAFSDNNYNGCLNHIRAAAAVQLKVSGGEWESAAAANVLLSINALDGHVVGPCSTVHFDGPQFTPTAGNSCISVVDGNMGTMVFTAPSFGNTTAPKVSGTAAIYALYSVGANNSGGGPTFDGLAQNHWEVGNNGLGAIALTTNLPVSSSPTLDADWVRANGTGSPASGFGLELIHNGTSGSGGLASIVAYDRSQAKWQSLQVGASDIKLQVAGSTIAEVKSTGVVISGTIAASNIGSAASHASADFLAAPASLADRIALARVQGTGVALAQSAAAVLHTGDTIETTLATISVPANAMGANGRIEIEAEFSFTNSPNSKTLRAKFGGNQAWVAGPTTSTGTVPAVCVANRNSASSQRVLASHLNSNNTVGGFNPSAMAVDTSADTTVDLTCQLASPADAVTLESYRVVLFPED